MSLPQNQGDTELETLIKRYLLTRLGQILKTDMDSIKKDVNFMDLGIDSNQLVQLSKEIESEIQIELYPTLFLSTQVWSS